METITPPDPEVIFETDIDVAAEVELADDWAVHLRDEAAYYGDHWELEYAHRLRFI